ncbi:MAG: Na+/H+-dicarboxylate symporter [Bacteroidia bacterium]|jgi:Na+/H+-dicarboxylate symporter
MKKLALHWQVIIALILGLIYSLIAVKTNSDAFQISKFTLNYIEPLGTIFINVLKLIAVPLVLFSIISGIVNLKDIKRLGRVGTKTLLIYVATTVLSVSIGLLVVNLWKPGKQVDNQVRLEKRVEYENWLTQNPGVKKLDDLNVLADSTQKELVQRVLYKTAKDSIDKDVQDKLDKALKTKAEGPLQPLVDVVPDNIFTALADMQMLQIIFFSIFFGIILILLPIEEVKPMVDFVNSANVIFVRMVEIVMISMPFFVFALMAGTLVKMAGGDVDKLNELLYFLLNYGLAVVIGLAIMAFVVYPTMIKLFVKNMSVKKFLRGIRKAQLTAFSTSSSVATLPITMDCVENELGVPKSTTSFVLPIGATVNMDGTSMYQAIAVVALAQLHMVDLDISQQLVIVATATLASIGAAAVPSAGLVLMILVLESVGLNPAWIAIILPVDRILDMCRTVVNVTGDATVSLIVADQ